MDKRANPPLVLVIDDDARSASLLARMLRGDGFDVEVTIDGAAALARLTRDPVPGAIVTELYLPHADGLAISRYARSRRPTIPIFIVTGHPDGVSTALAAQPLPPPLQVLAKPLDYPDLLRRLASELGVTVEK